MSAYCPSSAAVLAARPMHGSPCSSDPGSWPASHVQVYPHQPSKGSQQATLGVFLAVEHGAGPVGFALTIVNQLDPRKSVRRGVISDARTSVPLVQIDFVAFSTSFLVIYAGFASLGCGGYACKDWRVYPNHTLQTMNSNVFCRIPGLHPEQKWQLDILVGPLLQM